MLRTRTGWLVAAVAAFGLGAGACKKDSGSGSGGGVAGAMGNPDIAMIPADSDIVFGLNFSQLQQSAMWKQYSPMVLNNASKELGEFKATCGFDPLESVKSVSIGAKNLDGKMPTGAVVIHGLDKAKVVNCLKSEKVKADMAKDGASFVEDGDVYMIKDQSGAPKVGFTFPSGDAMLLSFGESVTKDTLLTNAKGAASLKTSAKFVEMFTKINTKDSVWVFVNGNAPFMKAAEGFGVKAQAVFGSLNVTDGLALDLRVRSATPDEAKSIVDLGKQQANDQVKSMFDKLDISQDGVDAHIQLALSEQKLKQLTSLMGGALGSMLGGAMGGGMAPPTPTP